MIKDIFILTLIVRSMLMRILVFCFILGLPFHCYSKELKIDESISENYYLTGKYLEILEDSSSSMTIEEVIKSGNFKKSDSDKIPFIENTSYTYWIRFKLKNAGQNHEKWILEILDQHIENVKIFIPYKNKYISTQTGFAIPFTQREFLYKNFAFQIFPDSTTSSYYVKVKSGGHNGFYMKVKTFHNFSMYSINEYYLLGMFYGILLIIAAYNIILFISMKEKVYVLYVLYVLCAVVILLEEDGTGFQYLWNNYPLLNKVISKSSSLLLLLTFSIYSKKFLELKNNLPVINKILIYLLIGYVLFFILDISFLHISQGLLYLFPYFLLYISAIVCYYKKGYKTARFYILGYSFMLLSIILLFLRMSGLTHWDDLFTLYSFNIGLVFEVVVLSYALADRFKIIRKEKETQLLENQQAQKIIITQLKENEELKDLVNRELEDKVKERTLQLEEQAVKIALMNEVLKEHNLSLETKIKVVATSRVMQEAVSFEEFKEIYPDEESCLKYIAKLKEETKYSCKKCKGKLYSIPKDSYSRRCLKCGYTESVTAGTLFHKLKFPIVKAFYILFLVSNRKNMTLDELSSIIELRRPTCWAFKFKIEKVMESNPAPKSNTLGWSYWILNF